MRAASPGVSVNDRPSSPSPAGPSSQNANLAAPPWAVPARAAPPSMGGAPIVSRQSRASGPGKSYRDASAPRRIRPPSRCLAPGAAAVPGATAQPARPSGARIAVTRSVKSRSARSADTPGSARPAAHSGYAPERVANPKTVLPSRRSIFSRGGADSTQLKPPRHRVSPSRTRKTSGNSRCQWKNRCSPRSRQISARVSGRIPSASRSRRSSRTRLTIAGGASGVLAQAKAAHQASATRRFARKAAESRHLRYSAAWRGHRPRPPGSRPIFARDFASASLEWA